jgi:UDP-GlcNAc3NAcA epimerase
MELISVVGARPQFIKAAILSEALRERPEVRERVIHTGQHYDPGMSQVFFDQLGLPEPSWNLGVGSASHGEQTGQMLAKLEEILLTQHPDAVLVYGDTNSTLAGALAAAKLRIPVVHVEAGLRSFNRRMPEEINRVVADRLSSLLLCPTPTAVSNLAGEGIRDGVHLVGDVMYDCLRRFDEMAPFTRTLQDAYGLRRRAYVLMTCHRAENTDDRERLGQIMQAANRVAEILPVLFLVHPRTRKAIAAVEVTAHANLLMAEPVSYLQMLALEREAALILTDSGGVQKEAFFYGVPCVSMRDETEWVETVESGANRLAGADADRIVEAVEAQLGREDPLPDAAEYYGGGKACRRSAALIAEHGAGCPTR